ncbi:MAG: BCCT family transporter [Rubrobacteraceae bacterium]
MQRLRSQIGPVFIISVSLSILFVLWGVFFTDNLSNTFTAILNYVIATFGWVYLLAVSGFLVFVVYLAFSRYGRIKLGKDNDEPEFTTLGWLSMLFAAGVGLSFLFWGVAEPASHFGTPPYGMAKAETTEAAELSLQYTFFHWGFHPWAVYAVVAMSIAYFNFRKDGGNLVSAALRPLLGDRVDGPIGKAVDIFAIYAVLFGVATALGIGALQLNGGLSYVFDIPNNATVQITIIGILTVAFMISAATGIDRGILYLSLINMVIAVSLLFFTLFAGPTVFLLNTFTQSIGQYLGAFANMSFRAGAFTDSEWAQSWTLFYWAWWISWAPFVGTFIARISRGRTIREFVGGVLFAPVIFSFLWFTVFGGAAIHLDLYQGGNIAQTAANDLPKSLFDTLTAFPLGAVTSILALVLVSIFFVTSADSATFVLSTMSTDGAVNPSAPIKLTWGVIIASFAGILLLTGGLGALQTATITAAVPFTIVMFGLCISLYMSLSQEVREPSAKRRGSGVGDPVGKPAPSSNK